MEVIPVELWEKIGRYACLDGGYTGCSLSLVSRFMRDATRMSRYTSVALLGEERCHAFVGLLNRTNTHLNILHLFVSVNPEPAPEETRKLYVGLCTEILHHAAPTLRTLALHHHINLHVFDNGLCFPHLRHLSLPSPDLRYRDPEVESYICPAVERLHFTHWALYGGVQLYEAIVALAPSATCVRLTGIKQNRWLGSFLRALLDVPGHNRIQPDIEEATEIAVHFANIAALLPNIHSFIVQPGKYDDSGWSCTGAEMHDVMKWDLESLVRDIEDRDPGGRQLVVLEDTEGYGSSQALEDWLDVVGGGDGPWAPARARYATPASAPPLVPLKTYKETVLALLETHPPHLEVSPSVACVSTIHKHRLTPSIAPNVIVVTGVLYQSGRASDTALYHS